MTRKNKEFSIVTAVLDKTVGAFEGKQVRVEIGETGVDSNVYIDGKHLEHVIATTIKMRAGYLTTISFEILGLVNEK